MPEPNNITNQIELAVARDKREEPFKVPDAYFGQLSLRILAQIDELDSKQDEMFFEKQKVEILAAVQDRRNEISIKSVKTKQLTLWLSVAATAALAIFIWIKPNYTAFNNNQFAELIKQNEFNEDDLHYLISNVDENEPEAWIGILVSDPNRTLDSLLQIRSSKKYQDDYAVPSEQIGRENKADQIKPLVNPNTSNTILLDDQDILQYLLHESDDLYMEDWY